jgi:hypothetical protein
MKFMVTVNITGLAIEHTSESGRTIRCKDMAKLSMTMAVLMMANSISTKSMEQVNLCGLMNENIRAAGFVGSNMVKE